MTKSNTMHGVKKIITRNRTSYSCQCCRKRKVKCDKGHPICGECQKNGETCMYETPSKEDFTPGASETGSGKRRKHDEDQFRISVPEEPSNVLDEAVGQNLTNAAFEERLSRLSQLLEALKQTSRGLNTAKPGFGHASISTPDGMNDSGQSFGSKSPPSLVHATTPESMSSQEHHSRDQRDVETNRRTIHDSDAMLEHSDPLSTLTNPLVALQLSNFGQAAHQQSQDLAAPFWAHIDDELQQLSDHAQHRQNDATGVRSVRPQQGHGKVARNALSSIEPIQSLYSPQPQPGGAEFTSMTPVASQDTSMRNQFDKTVLLECSPVVRDFSADVMNTIGNLLTAPSACVLFRCWLFRVHPIMPVIATLPVLIKHQAFWAWFREGRLNGKRWPDMNFMPLLCTIWYCGITSMPLDTFHQYFPNGTRAQLRHDLHNLVVYLLQRADFPMRPTLQTLSAYVLILSIPLTEEAPLKASTYLGLAIKSAQILGIHRNPAHLPDVSTMEGDIRIRLWWRIVDLDIATSLSAGLPPQIQGRFSDVPLPEELRDEFIDTDIGRAYLSSLERNEVPTAKAVDPHNSNNPSLVCASMMAYRARSLAVTTLTSILEIHLGTSPIDRNAAFVIAKLLGSFDTQCSDTVNRIPTRGVPELDFTPSTATSCSCSTSSPSPSTESNPTFSNPLNFHDLHRCTHTHEIERSIQAAQKQSLLSSHKFHRIHLSFLSDRMHCIAYAPWLKSAKSRLWHGARQCALRFSFGCLRKFIALCSDPELEMFRWCVPVLARPLHAVMIVLVDLYERPTSKEASRGRGLVDRVISLDKELGSGGLGVRALTESWAEAWEMLLSLREKGWRRARLDPRVLWTEEDQVSVGVAGVLSERERSEQSLREDRIGPIGGYDGNGRIQVPRQEGPTHNVLRELLGTSETEMGIAAAGVRGGVGVEACPSNASAAGRNTCSGQDDSDEIVVIGPLLRAGTHQVRMPYEVSSTNTGQSSAKAVQMRLVNSQTGFQSHQQNVPYASMVDDRHGENDFDHMAFAASNGQYATPNTTYMMDFSMPDLTGPYISGIESQRQETRHEENEDFDWNRWDKVFASFSDLMDFDVDMDVLHAA